MRKTMLFLLAFFAIVLVSSHVAGSVHDGSASGKAEQDWLLQREGKLEVLFGYEAPPNAYHDDSGRYVGLLVDFLREIEVLIGVGFVRRDFSSWNELIEYSKQGRNFIIVGIARTADREKYLAFTDSFIKIPYVIVTRKQSAIGNMSDLVGKAVCTVANYAVNDYIALYHSAIKTTPVTDNLKGLQAVSTGACDAMVVNQMYATYLIDKEGITNLKIAGNSGYLNRLSAATSIHDQKLFQYLDTVVDQIDVERQQDLFRKWVSISEPLISEETLRLIKAFALVLIVFVAVLLVWTVFLRRRMKRQTQRLKDSEEQLRSVIQDSPALVCRNLPDGTIVFVNDAYCDYFGMTQDELVGSNFFMLIPEAERKQVRSNLNSLSAEKPILVHEHEVFAPDGSIRYHRWTNRGLCDEDGNVVLMQAYGEDVTGRKLAENALLESEERFRSFFNQSFQFALVLDVDGNVIEMNNLVREITGHYADDVVGKPFWDAGWWRKFPDVQNKTRYAIKLAQAGESVNDEVVFLDKDENIHNGIRLFSPLLDQNGVVKRISVVGMDVSERVQAEASRRMSETHLRTLIETLPDLVWLKDPDGVYLTCNARFERFFGASEEEIRGKTDYDFVERGLADFFREKDRVAMMAGKPSRNEEEIVYADDGHREHLETIKTPMRDEHGNLIGVLGVGRDITERKLIEERLRLSASVFESTVEGVVITDAEGNIVDVNRAFHEIMGYTREDVLGNNPRLWKSGHHDRDFYQNMWESLKSRGEWRGEIWNRRKDGSVFPEWQTISSVYNSEGKLTHYVSVFSDISHIKESQDKLDHLAHYDPLTDLPNRLLLTERLNQAIRHADRAETSVAVIILDIDRFKHINDSLGHPVGDKLLEQVALRLLGVVRNEDTVARIGGDEFVIILEGITKSQNVAVTAQKLVTAFRDSFQLEGHEIGVSPSLGVCIYPQDGANTSELLRNADAAMYRAKESGRNSYHFYTEELTSNAFERVLLESSLRQGLERDELLLEYQPQMLLNGGKVIGVEALVRWQHPELGLIPPGRFIPLAEDTGLIHKLGDWVLHTACRQGVEWLENGFEFGRLAINISGPQLQHGDLPLLVDRMLVNTGFPAERLELEVSEGFIMRQVEKTISQLKELQQMGITLAIDDFGTGYSSLSYLKQLPINKLKIDQSFVRDIPEDPDDMAIAAAVIALGSSMGLEVIAEGVETQEQAEFLKESGCEQVQGFLYSRPVGAVELEPLLVKSDSEQNSKAN